MIAENGDDASILRVRVFHREVDYVVIVPQDAEVRQLQEEIHRRCFQSRPRFSPIYQVLSFNNELLHASQPLTSYGIQNDSLIHLSVIFRVFITTSTHRASLICNEHSTVRETKETVGRYMYRRLGYDSEIATDRLRFQIPNQDGFLADQGVLQVLGIGHNSELNLSIVN